MISFVPVHGSTRQLGGAARVGVRSRAEPRLVDKAALVRDLLGRLLQLDIGGTGGGRWAIIFKSGFRETGVLENGMIILKSQKYEDETNLNSLVNSTLLSHSSSALLNKHLLESLTTNL